MANSLFTTRSINHKYIMRERSITMEEKKNVEQVEEFEFEATVEEFLLSDSLCGVKVI